MSAIRSQGISMTETEDEASADLPDSEGQSDAASPPEKGKSPKDPFRCLLADPRYLSVGAASRYVALVLWCGDVVPGTGLAALKPGSIEAATAMDWSELEPALDALKDADLVRWSGRSRMIWLKGRAAMPGPRNRDIAIHATKRTMDSFRYVIGSMPTWIYEAVADIAGSHPFWHVERMQALITKIDPVKGSQFAAPPETRAQPTPKALTNDAILAQKLLRSGKLSPDFELEAEPPQHRRTQDMTGVVEEALDAWDRMAEAAGLSKAWRNPKSRSTVRARLRENGPIVFAEMVRLVGESAFLTGRVRSQGYGPFRATLEFCCKPEKFNKILGGGYGGDDAGGGNAVRGSQASIVQGVRKAFDPGMDPRYTRPPGTRSH